MSIEESMKELRWCAGFEDLGGAIAAARKIAALDSDDAVRALVELLEQIDAVDLTDDAGDIGDEVSRLRQAVTAGLEACGPRAIAPLRPLIARPPSGAGEAALLVLAKLGDESAAPVAIEWVEQGVRSALLPLGLLAPAEAVPLLARTIEHAAEPNAAWTKRLAARALGKIRTDAALAVLERLLDDDDWYARLGAAEALCDFPGERARRLRERAQQDRDSRVAAAARG